MLHQVPYEVLQNIVFWAANDYVDGHYCCSLPSTLPAIFLTSRHIHDALLVYEYPEHTYQVSNVLFVRLFEEHFNREAFERRFRLVLTHAELAAEYKKRMGVLKRIKQDLYRIEDLWTILLMIYEDDGKNMQQLLAAGVEDWVRRLIQSCTTKDEEGWPVETLFVQLSFAIFSFVSTLESVERISPDEKDNILDILDMFNGATHRYSIAHFPIAFSNYPQNLYHALPHSLLNFGPALVSQTCEVQHFDQTLMLAPPTAIESTICVAHLLMERRDIPIIPNTPKNRAEAVAMGRSGPTEEDNRENNIHRKQGLGSLTPHAGSARERANYAKLVNPREGSLRFDPDFWRIYFVHWATHPRNAVRNRISQCWYNTVMLLGLINGNWFGRLMIPMFGDFTNMAQIHPAAPRSISMVPQTMQLNMDEHFKEGFQLSYGDARNAYMPQGVDPSRGQGVYETYTNLYLNDPEEDDTEEAAIRTKCYKTFRPGIEVPQVPRELMPSVVDHANFPPQTNDDMEEDIAEQPMYDREDAAGQPMELDDHSSGSQESDLSDDDLVYHPEWDIILTGMTDYLRSLAWGGYKVYGRVRQSDGLITLVRVPVDEQIGQGRWVFAGYLRASTTLVGQWRETGAVIQEVGYGGVFMITKVGDTWGVTRE